MDPALQELISEGEPDDEVALVLRLAAGMPPPPSVRLVARFGDVATCRVQRDDILPARSSTAVISIKAPHRYVAEPWPDGDGDANADADAIEDAEAFDTDLRPGDLRRPEALDATGRGVLLAHIDWGADIAHPDFRHADGRTRFVALWDQGARYDPARPNRYGYGRIHTAADIDRALAADDPYAALAYHPGRGKPLGGSHGTHTLGISGGNGRVGGPQGLAPEAMLAFVDLSTHHELKGSGLGDSAALLEGLDFLAGVAAQLGAERGAPRPDGEPLPLVVNASLGRQAGQHDGRTLTEQAMDAFVAERPGRAIVQSTGNYFNRQIHASGLLRPGQSRPLRLRVATMPHPAHELDLWYPGVDRVALTILGPGIEPVAVRPDHPAPLVHEGRVIGRAYHRLTDPNNGDNQIVLYLDADAPGGEWTLQLDGLDIVDGRFHAWIERGPGRGAAQARFVDEDDSPCCTVGTICNGWRTLAVGAIDAHDDDRPLAPYSSGGPTRDGRGKPDLVAPGHQVLSACSAALRGQVPLLKRMSGTSMAAPHVAGTVALMFSAARGPLPIQETRRLLLASTRPHRRETSFVQHWRRGCGELDVIAAVAAVRAAQAAQAATTSGSNDAGAPPGAPATTPPAPVIAPRDADGLLRSSDMTMPTRPELEAAEAAAAHAYAEALSPPRAPLHCACGECAECHRAEQEAAEAAAESAAESAEDAEGCGCADATSEDWAGAGEEQPIEATRADDRVGREVAALRRERIAMRRQSAFAPIAAPAPAALPFQFQIPLGGGSPALSVPVGGAGSPLAFAVPLGGAPTAPAAPSPAFPPAPTTTAAAAATAAPANPPLAGDAPLNIVTSIDFPAATEDWPAEGSSDEGWSDGQVLPSDAARIGMAMLREAEAACAEAAPCGGTAQLVARLLDAANPGARLQAGLGTRGAPSATALFNAFEYGHAHPMRPRLREQYGRHLQRLAGPGDALDDLEIRAGDWVVRVALGQGFGQLSVVASPLVGRHEDLPSLGWRTGSRGGRQAPPAGRYLQVVEVLPIRRPARDRWARRIADPRGRLLPGNLLLRPYGRPAEWEETPEPEDVLEAVAQDAGTDVRWLQDALNRVMGLRLAVDGAAGPQTRQAVRSFQSSRGLAVDGIAGPQTLGALRAALGGAPASSGPTTTAGGGAPRASGGPGAGPDCSQLTHFPQGGDDISPAHQTLLIAAARRILSEGIRVVLVTGFASSEGGDADNFVLGQRRADRVARELRTTLERMRPGSSAGVAMIATSRGESEQIAGGDLGLNRRVMLCLQVNRPTPRPPQPRPQPQPTPVETQVFRVVAKSFIARIGSNIGSLDCGIDIGPLTIPGASNLGLRALAFATDQAFSEDPASDAIFTSPPPDNKGYRLFSRGRLSVDRRGTEAVGASLVGGLDTDAGKECVPGIGACLQAPPLIVDQTFSTRRVDASRIAFRWGVKGRPPTTVEPGFNAICHRDSVFIWHQVKGTIDCSSGTAVITNLVVEGSRFPSHRVWLDGTRSHEVRQGPFSNLWDSASGDPSRVR